MLGWLQIPEQSLKDIELSVREIKESIPIFFTRMAPSHFFDVRNINSKKPLTALSNTIILCVSAIGSANAFVQGMKKVLLSRSLTHSCTNTRINLFTNVTYTYMYVAYMSLWIGLFSNVLLRCFVCMVDQVRVWGYFSSFFSAFFPVLSLNGW